MALLVLLGAAALALSACGGGGGSGTSTGGSSTSGGSSTQAGGTSSGSGNLVVADNAVATNLDPDGPASNVIANLTAVENSYEPLVKLGTKPNPGNMGGGQFLDASKVVPALAQSWTTKGNTWTFTLRSGAMSPTGHEFTADDVVWTYKRALALKATGAFLWGVFINAKSVKALDKTHVQIVTKGPAPMLLDTLALASQIWPIDSTEAKAHATAKDKWAAKWLGTHTAGYGPFTVTANDPPQSVVLSPNTKYYGAKPTRGVKMIAIPDSSQRFTSLQQGDVDVALTLTPQQLQQAKSNSNLHVFQFQGNANTSVYLNFKVPALRSQLVRQALWYATPSQQIIKSVYLGNAFLLKSPLPSYVPGYAGQYWNYNFNIAKAKALMAKAGYAKGFSTQMYYATNDPTLASVATILQSTWAQIGVKLKLTPQPQATLVTRSFGQKDLPVYLIDTASQIIPDGAIVGALYSSTGFGNTSHYQNPAFDKAFAQSVSSLDFQKRLPSIQEMQRQLVINPAFIPVVGLTTSVVTSSKVTDWSWNPSQAQYFAPATTAAAG